MKQLIVISCLTLSFIASCILMFGCQRPASKVLQKTWYPTKIQNKHFDTTTGIYAITFTRDSMKVFTLGTPYYQPSSYKLGNDSIYLFNQKDSAKWKFILTGESSLEIQFNSTSSVFYTSELGDTSEDLIAQLKEQLLRKNWMLKDSVMFEFRPSLEYQVVKAPLKPYIKNIVLHAKHDDHFNYHTTAGYSVNYFNGYNVLCIGELVEFTGNHFIIIESVGDSLITGFWYDRNGKRENIALEAVPNDTTIAGRLQGDWSLVSYEEVTNELDLREVWASFGDEKGIDLVDLEKKALSLHYQQDRFQFKAYNNLIAEGTWQLDPSGKVLKWVAEYENGEVTRPTYQTILKLNDDNLIVLNLKI